jgi:tetratricopeptide (TPR) repeat protein
MLTAGPAAPTAIRALIKSTDSVQWVLYYPPLSDARAEGDVPATEQCRGLAAPSNETCLTQRAEVLLRLGRIEDARRNIDEAIALNSGNGDANALRAIIQIAGNDKVAALESASAATVAAPEAYRAWLALSYAQQSAFKLEQALATAEKARALEPKSSLVNARVAELLLSLGRIKEAETAARSAVDANPLEARAHTVLGFVHLAQIDTKAARADFQMAIERDSFDPLARLGLGLAIIRDGKLALGREQIEIAVALDPTNSLLRSYIGKAYFEEKRDRLGAGQLAIAKELDPNDPTPWFYDAIREQTTNQPVTALHEMQRSMELNNNRAVYRSRLRLDEDLAARSSGLGGIYRNLGFEQLALIEGYESLVADPGNYSGHRLLADHYDSLPRHEIARVNELFRSQLLQPINATPIPAQLGQASLFLNTTAGPSDVSFNEFTQLFNRNQLRVQASGVIGGRGTRGDDVTVAGIRNGFSFSLGQYHFMTDGFRENNDSEQEVLNAFFQYAISESTSALAELRTTELDQGDLNLLFDLTRFDQSLRQTEQTNSLRFGMRHEFTPRSLGLASILYQKADVTAIFDPGFDFKDRFEGITTELQHIYRGDGWNLTSGARYINLDQDETQTAPVFLPDPPFVTSVTAMQSFGFRDFTAYIYSDVGLPSHLRVTLGSSVTSSVGRSFDKDQFNPKIGVVWGPVGGTTVRAAAFRTLQPTSFSRSNIQPFLEPTEVAGFNQFFFGVAGEDVWRYGIALDQQLAANMAGGFEFATRDIETPVSFIGPPEESFVLKSKEFSGRAYFFWTPALTRNLSLRVEYEYDKQDNEDAPAFGSTMRIRTHRVPLGINYFTTFGLGVDLLGTHVDQKGTFLEFLPIPPFVNEFSDDDESWIFDASVSYRLGKRHGLVTLTAKNLFDEKFKFQDVDPGNPRILPERLLLLKFTLDFSL